MFEDILAHLAASLGRHKIPYIVIGGQAVLLYGEPRLTRDIDITLGMGTDGLPALLALLSEISLRPLPENPEAFAGQTMVLPTLHEETGVRVDFIFSFTPFEQEAIARARIVTLRNQNVRFASPEDLVIHKIFAGRPRDLEDALSVVRNQRDMDRDYVRTWLERFDEETDARVFVERFLYILNSLEK